MRNHWLKIAAVTLPLLCAGMVSAADDPGIHQVYAAAEAGRFDEAQTMMNKVLQDHPNSAKAHYVEAELLAKQGRIANAAAELQKAESLEPGLPFAKPQSVQQLKQLINGANSQNGNFSAHAAQNGTSWTGIILGGGVVLALIFFLRALFARRAVPNYMPASNGGYGPGYGVPPAGQMPPMGGGGVGSGIMSGLATGAAVGAGMVAGEALAHRFLDGNQHNGTIDNSATPVNGNFGNDNFLANDDMGGNDFGLADNSSWDDNSSFGGDSSGDW